MMTQQQVLSDPDQTSLGETDPISILATKMSAANAADQVQFVCST